MSELIVRSLRGNAGFVPWSHSFAWMRAFTDSRSTRTPDELWVLQHPSIFTLGQAANPDHLLDTGDTPVVRTDRGGQVTWHGPGQTVLYALIDLRRRQLGVRDFVTALEASMLDLLAQRGVPAAARRDAPGVYLTDVTGAPGAKIGALGVRVRRGCTYHGLSFNVNPDLTAYQGINPCGLLDQSVGRLSDLTSETDVFQVGEELAGYLGHRLEVTEAG